MLFGAHVSVAGGVQNAPLNAAKLGCEVFQFFSRSPQGGTDPKISPKAVDEFRASCEEHGLREWVVHTPYYINLASGEERTRQNSIRIIREELERACLLGAAYVMFHPGSAKDVGEEKGLFYAVEGIKAVYDGYHGQTQLLVEISAGAGKVIGDRFEEVAAMIKGVGHPELGVCFDTAHAFASGYDLRTKEAVEETFVMFDNTVGLKRLKMSHCNDSKVDLGEYKDRHEHLGLGSIGLEGFRAMVHHPKLQNINFYLETEPVGAAKDLEILKQMRSEQKNSILQNERAVKAVASRGKKG